MVLPAASRYFAGHADALRRVTVRAWPSFILTHRVRGDVSRRLVAAVALLFVGTVADVWSTYLAISTGDFVEGSPVGRTLITLLGPLRGMILTKLIGMVVIGVPVAIAGGSRRLVAMVMCGGVGTISLLAAGRNLLLVAGLWP